MCLHFWSSSQLVYSYVKQTTIATALSSKFNSWLTASFLHVGVFWGDAITFYYTVASLKD